MTQPVYQKILVPVDGSKNSFKALKHAITLADSCKAELGILFVLVLAKQLYAYTQINTSYISDTVLDEIEEFGKKTLEEARALVPDNIPVQTFLEIGSPVEIIPDFAADNNYNLIAIGSRGLGTIKGLILGSVSAYVVANAKCPVLVVK
ncbi:MAG: universal stress protein [Pelosinus sp.]|nr:universal stress protein [Pelosinus sp.]